MRIELQNIQRRKIPGVAVVYAGVGELVTNGQLINEFGQRLNWDQEQRVTAVRQIAGAGINARYRFGNPYEGPTEDYRQEVVGASTALTRKALQTIGWDKADLLIAVNSVPPDEKSEWAKEVAKASGISEGHEVNATCNGGVMALVEAVRDPALRDSRVVITTHEAVSRFPDPGDFMSGVIFGNGGASMAFVPSRFDVMDAQTSVSEDLQGVIKVPKSYEITEDIKPHQFPEWFKVEDQARGITGRTDRLVRIALPEPVDDPNRMEMDGKKTGLYFADIVKRALLNSLEQYQNLNPNADRDPIELVVGHQPSKPVFDHVGKKVALEIAKNPEKYGSVVPEMPWVLEKAKMSNISPGTTFIAFAELLEQIQTGVPFIVLGYGVGSSVSTLTMKYILKL